MIVTVSVILPVIVVLGLIRWYKEIRWGHCKSNSSLHGKVFIITGANSGVGKAAARELARRKATVIMACRNMKSAREAVEDIRCSVKTGELIPMHLDLLSLSSVRDFASTVTKDFPKIHVLINNAGVFVPAEDRITEDGFEIHFAANHLGHFLLTNLLLKKLIESAPSRIVIVSSLSHESGNIDFDNVDGKNWNKGRALMMKPGYANSKLANVMFCRELARRLEGTGVNVYTLCPGLVYTGIFRNTPAVWLFAIIMAPGLLFFMRTPTKGAQTVLHCATSEEVEHESGLMYRDCKLYKSKKMIDPAVSRKLWEVSEQIVGLKTE